MDTAGIVVLHLQCPIAVIVCVWAVCMHVCVIVFRFMFPLSLSGSLLGIE